MVPRVPVMARKPGAHAAPGRLPALLHPLIGGGGNDATRARDEAGEMRKEKWSGEVGKRKKEKQRVRGNPGRYVPGNEKLRCLTS